ncbi:cysteine-rich tail protein 1 isoform X2 [Dendropsophus ebraccatus]|uniref:cysteine-rich tail protein 1 isoform X2 n=1 Tax=Dendropsophus ebraccatus TaxID=150705 RepID=UPI003831888E
MNSGRPPVASPEQNTLCKTKRKKWESSTGACSCGCNRDSLFISVMSLICLVIILLGYPRSRNLCDIVVSVEVLLSIENLQLLN